MIRTSFNDGWTAGRPMHGFDTLEGADATAKQVQLPHDQLLSLPRSATNSPRIAYFPSGAVQYTKRFDVSAGDESRRISVEFDGVYRDAMVYVNGDFAGQRPNGYSRFRVRLDPFLRYGGSNEIRVVARVHEDSRWYTGMGIYRDVHLLTGALVHVEPDGLRVSTPDVDAERAIIASAVRVVNQSTGTRTVEVHTRVRDAEGETVATDVAPLTMLAGRSELLRQRLSVTEPRRWSADTPYLYTVDVTLHDPRSGDEIDEESTRFGIRTLQLDPVHGLRVNGETVKLRGACVHHDNGVIGAVAIRRAEERKVELLKAAGFNAIRSAHNPLSPAMLDACDRVGMYVMDEAFDMWADSKSMHDYSLAFAEWFERDVDAMVAKDFNHPSVIIYSIGNEISETGSPIGSGWGRRIAERIRESDPTRYVTNALNLFLSVLPHLGQMMADTAVATGDINDTMAEMNGMGDTLDRVGASELVSRATAESFAALDIAGVNYGESRYELDRELFPNRVLVGSETFPGRIAENWRLIMANGNTIGDFTWTGWDYLGEAGLGRHRYAGDEDVLSTGSYPWLLSWAGDIDITGHRRPASFYREIVFGLRREPFIAVLNPDRYADESQTGLWSWSDSIGSWSFDIPPGAPVRVDVYSSDPSVELFVNGTSMGTRPAGEANRYTAEFDVAWEPGEIVAEGIAADGSRRRFGIRSADPSVRLGSRADRSIIRNHDGDLAFIECTLEDAHGTLATHRRRRVHVEIEGPGSLQGFGSADPHTEDRFDIGEAHTFQGRALAVVRPTGSGEITVTFTADGETSTTTIQVEA